MKQEHQNILCVIGLHKLTKYVDLCNAQIQQVDGLPRDVLIQEARCILCNAATRRIVNAK